MSTTGSIPHRHGRWAWRDAPAGPWAARRRPAVRRLLLALCAIVLYGVALATADAQTTTPTLAVVSQTDYTGTPAFSACTGVPAPGDDCAVADAYVRTNDSGGLRVDYSVNPAGTTATGAVITVTVTVANPTPGAAAPDEVLRLDAPVGCASYTLPSGTHAQRAWVCTLGTVPGGTSASLRFPYRTVHGGRQGQTLTFAVAFRSNEAAAPAPAPVGHTISALPRLDLVKNYGAVMQEPALGPDGVTWGQRLWYPLSARWATGKGGEQLGSSFSFTDQWTAGQSLPTGARLYTWGPYGAAGACFPNGQNGQTNPTLPYGAYSLGPEFGAPAYSVVNSGQWQCSQAAPGAAVALTITGADTSARTYPSWAPNDTSLSTHYVLAGNVAFWLPNSEITAVGGQVDVTNTYTSFDPVSVSGQSNYGAGTEPTGNNATSHTLLANAGYFSKWWTDVDGDVLTNQSAYGSGNGVVVPTQLFAASLSYRLTGETAQSNLKLCEKLPLDYVTFTGTTAYEVRVNGVRDATLEGQAVYRYGVGPNVTDPTAYRTATCADAGIAWYATPGAAPGGAASINYVEVTAPNVPLLSDIRFRVQVRARSTNLAGQQLAMGTRLPNQAAWQMNGGAWQVGAYDPVSHYSPGANGDRVWLSQGVLSTYKEARRPASIQRIVSIGAGEAFRWLIPLRLTYDSTGAPSQQPVATGVVFTDTLPADFVFTHAEVWDSVNGGRPLTFDRVTANPDGTTTLGWDVGNLPASPEPWVSIYGYARYNLPSYTPLTNRVTISAADTHNRTASASYTVTVIQYNALAICKEVETPQVPLNHPLTFTLRYDNTTTGTLADLDLIDVLPWHGDSRTPRTDYTGQLALQQVSPGAGETILYSHRPPATIAADPNDPSNQPANATTGWCATYDGSGGPNCPASLAQVTAIRLLSPAFSSTDPERTVTLVLSATGNLGGDWYVNSFAGRTSSLALPVYSNDVPVRTPGAELAHLGNFVWWDSNRDGRQGNDATGPTAKVPPTTVTLYDAGGNVVATTLTDADGYYYFNQLRPGTYQVGVALPAGYSFTTPNVGPDAAIDSDFDPATGRTGFITLAPGQTNYTVDAGLQKTAGLGDFVWHDLDRDGVQDAGEPGLPGVTVRLYNNAGALVGTTATNAAGYYGFTLAAQDFYTVEFGPPAGYTFSPRDQGGDDNLDSDADLTTGRAPAIRVRSGDIFLHIDAGLYRTGADLGDRVWYDANANGRQNEGEAGIAGVPVTLYDQSNNAVATTTTDSNGNYLFGNLTSGTYSVGFTAPSGYAFSPANQGADDAVDSDAQPTTGRTGSYTVVAGQTNLTIDAGLYQPAHLGDRVWLDTDRDGRQAAGETGVAGVTVTLYDDLGAVRATTVTDAAGYYSFTLPAGAYQVGFTRPADYQFSPFGQGGDPALDSDADPVTGRSGLIVLAPGATNDTVDAGLYPEPLGWLAELGDFVWHDLNQDGVQDPGEPGLPDVTVTLYDELGTVLTTTVTTGSGYYNFGLAAAGGYQVGFTPPLGYAFSPADQGADDEADSDADPATGRVAVFVAPGQFRTDVDTGLHPTARDYGDLPLGYEGGSAAWHQITGLYLGAAVSPETAPQPDVNAQGDADDGVARLAGTWTPGATVPLSVTLSGPGELGAWLDWNNDGVFGPAEFTAFTGLSAGAQQLDLVVGSAYTTGQAVYARFRLFPAGTSVTGAAAGGGVVGGEVEDYYWTFRPTAVTLGSFRVAPAGPPAWYSALLLALAAALGWLLGRGWRGRAGAAAPAALALLLLAGPPPAAAAAGPLTPLTAADLPAWYQAQTGYAAHPADFGAYALAPLGDQLYLGLGTGAPGADSGALLARLDAGGLAAVAALPEAGFLDLTVSGGRLYIPGVDPLADWTLGNLYIYDPARGQLTQRRTLPQTIHAFGVDHDPLTGRLSVAVARHLGDNATWGGGVYTSWDAGATWTLAADPALGATRTYDVLTVSGAQFAVANTADVTCRLAYQPRPRPGTPAGTWAQFPYPLGCTARLMPELSGRGVLALSHDGRLAHAADQRGIHTLVLPGPAPRLPQWLAAGAGRYYVADATGQVWATADWRQWTRLAQLAQPPLAIAYWPARQALVISTRGASGAVYLLPLA